MPRKPKDVPLGKRVVAARLQRGLTQGILSRRSGIDPSYLSRIETGKIQPTVRTATRIATALRMSLPDLLGPSKPARKDGACPVSISGRCMMDLIDIGPEPGHKGGTETYSRRQLRLLRRFAALVQRGDTKVLGALDVLVKQMLLQGAGGKR